jgi:NAD+ kinase
VAAIGFVVHPQREGAPDLARSTGAWLESLGHEAHVLETGPFPHLDLAVSLGGDGTMLRTVDMVAESGVPVLGANLGHLGYLTAVEPDQLRSALEAFLAGRYRVESRMTLEVSVHDGTARRMLQCAVLNDVVLQRPAGLHTVRLELIVNGSGFMSFAADSLILATPTGSTAYNLSARGPIVSPRARVLIVTAVAPHTLFDRSLVLDADEEVAVVPLEGVPADVVVDGRLAATLRQGWSLHCRQGTHDARLVTFGDRDFHHILKSKFSLPDR